MGPCRWPGLVGAVSRGCRFIWSNKKTAPYPTWDKSCTPAIPPKLTFWKTSARFTRHHACPMDNGWVPVGIYLDCSVQAALESPFTRPRPALIPPPKALFRFALPATTLSHRFVCCSVVVAIIAAPFSFVNPQFFNSLKKIFQGPAGTGGPCQIKETQSAPSADFRKLRGRYTQTCPPPRPAPAFLCTWGTPPADSWRSRAGRWCRRAR